MTVYVDDMETEFRGMRMCHMIGSDEAELHSMAERIGMRREWFQRGDHYDVPQHRKAQAVAAGAVEITRRQAALMIRMARLTGSMGTPEEAEAWHRRRVAEKAQARTRAW